ncbi:hypothetical protein O6H91_Y105700 [Diphasiastrum complanatum]|nr:hypothetical protein O6H91_Y105700 [Diphasiastrum complanatum]
MMSSLPIFRPHQRLWKNFQLPAYNGIWSLGVATFPSLEALSQSSVRRKEESILGAHWHYSGVKCLFSKVSARLNSGRIFSSSKDISTVCDTVNTSTTEPLVKRFTTEIGSTLKINLLGTNAKVNVLEGGDNEAILLEADWNDGRIVEYWTLFDISSSKNLISLTRKTNEVHSNGVVPLDALRAIIPGRWCNLELEAGQQPTYIECLNEASIRVKTTGGDIKIGRSKGSIACIESNGGAFEAIAVSAATKVKTCGGRISIEKLVGNTINMESGGGNVNVRSLYGGDVTLISGGGRVDVRHMQVSSSTISTQGGAVSINGLGGNLKILSSGGNVIIQLHEDAMQVDIDSGRGDILVFIPAQLVAQVKHLGSGNLSAEGPVSKMEAFPGVFTIQAASEDLKASNSSSMCEMTIHGSGSILFKQRSWLESLTKD